MIRMNTRSLVVCAAVVSGVFGLSACEQQPDPCTTAMPAPTAEQIAKVDRGLEVDESIEVNGYETECALVELRDGRFVWTSEPSD